MPDIDVLFAGDFRNPGSASAAMAHEIGVLSGTGYSVGLVHITSPLLSGDRAWHRDMKRHVAEGNAAPFGDGDELPMTQKRS